MCVGRGRTSFVKHKSGGDKRSHREDGTSGFGGEERKRKESDAGSEQGKPADETRCGGARIEEELCVGARIENKKIAAVRDEAKRKGQLARWTWTGTPDPSR